MTWRQTPRLLRYAGLAPLVKGSAGEGKQGNVTCLFHGCSDSALMSCAGASLAARADFAIFGDVLPKQVCLFVVNRQSLVCAELTKFGFGKEAAFSASFCGPEGSSIFSHLVLRFRSIHGHLHLTQSCLGSCR